MAPSPGVAAGDALILVSRGGGRPHGRGCPPDSWVGMVIGCCPAGPRLPGCVVLVCAVRGDPGGWPVIAGPVGGLSSLAAVSGVTSGAGVEAVAGSAEDWRYAASFGGRRP